jgi:plastocyanin
MRSRYLMVLVLLASLVLAGCGSDNKVGDESLVNFKDQAQERLGARTTTTAGPATTVAERGGQLGVGGATTTTRPTATTAPAPKQQTFEIDINSDNAGATQFDPAAARVFKGTVVTWTNKDAVARSVEADNGAFRSPSIPPGGTFTLTANTPGSFNYHDGTRPYAVASLEVVNR